MARHRIAARLGSAKVKEGVGLAARGARER